MSQNQHQVSIIGTPGSKHKQYDNATCVPRCVSASSHVSHMSQNPYHERISPEGRSCEDFEQDSDHDDDKVLHHNVAVHVDEEEDTKYEDCNIVSKSVDPESFSSCVKYRTPSDEEEYKCPEELFADIGIKFIDGEETGDENKDEDTDASSFSSTYRTPSNSDSDNAKIARDLSRDIKKTVNLSQELVRKADASSLDCSELSGYSFHSTRISNASNGSRHSAFGNQSKTDKSYQDYDISSPVSFVSLR